MRFNKGGFTIIESMIFLAVSGGMFLAAFAMLNGKQSTTEFNQSVQELETTINDIINDTSTGVFPELADIRCSFTAGPTGSPVYSAQSGAETGENNQCIFQGKLIQFGVGADADGYDNTIFVHTMVGKNLTSSVQTNGTSSYENFVLHSNGSGSSPAFDVTDELVINWGTRIKRAYYVDETFNGTNQTIYVWAAGLQYNQFGGTSNGSGGFLSGSTNIGLIAVTPDGPQALSTANAKTTLVNFRQALPLVNQRDFDEDIRDTIVVCLIGRNDQQAAILIGEGEGGLRATSTFDTPAGCLP